MTTKALFILSLLLLTWVIFPFHYFAQIKPSVLISAKAEASQTLNLERGIREGRDQMAEASGG